MLTYLLRRILLMVPTLIGMTFILFALIRFAPGVGSGGAFDDAGARRSDRAAAEELEKATKRRLGMIDAGGNPIPLQWQYFYWLGDSLKGNLGRSVKYSTDVSILIKERLPITLLINLISAVIVYLIAIPGGMLAAVRRGGVFDISWSFTSLALYSLPVIWVGQLAIGFICNPQYLALFPPAGIHSADTSRMTFFQYIADYLWHVALPVAVMSYGGFAYLTKIMRASMIDNITQDYTRTARAKGLSGFVVNTRHVFRNSLLPMITVFAGVVPGLLGGSVIIEKIFSIKGMGDLMLTAALGRDFPVIQSVSLIGSVITLIALLVTDVCYALADPRVSYD